MMFEMDRVVIGRQARNLGYNRDLYEKVCRIAHILRLLAEDGHLAEAVALKGGTAINLTVFEMPRLSVDIDLDLCENLPLREMTKARLALLDRLTKSLTAAGYVLRDKVRKTHALDSLTLEYVNCGETRDNLKIDINCVMRCHLYPPEKRKILPKLLEGELNVMCVHLVEMFAGKVAALLLRNAARDLYDIFLMINKGIINQHTLPAFKKAVIFYLTIGADSREFDLSAIRLQEIAPRDNRISLRPVLSSRDTFEPGSASAIVGDFLRELLILDEGEIAFVEGFRNGEYCPEALFPNPEIVERIRNHPMAIYKCNRIGGRNEEER